MTIYKHVTTWLKKMHLTRLFFQFTRTFVYTAFLHNLTYMQSVFIYLLSDQHDFTAETYYAASETPIR